MKTIGKEIWQIAAGNGEYTHYAKLCLDKDVIILGPGKCGPCGPKVKESLSYPSLSCHHSRPPNLLH